MSYYRAELGDFHVGRTYEQRFGDAYTWRKSILGEDDFTPKAGGHFHFMEIIINLISFANRTPYYKIEHLNDEHIESFGFLPTEDLGNYEKPGTYKVFTMGNFTVVFYKENLKVHIIETDKAEIATIFKGQVLDFNEFKTLIAQLGIVYDFHRKERIAERV